MHPDRDFELEAAPLASMSHFAQDLELQVLRDTACGEDRYLHRIFSAAIAAAWTNDCATIRYRQDVLRDCVRNGAALRELLALAEEPFGRKGSWYFSLFGNEASGKVASSVRMLQSSLALLKRFRNTLRCHAGTLNSTGFRGLLETLERNLADDYLADAHRDLDRLTFRSGVLLSADLGAGGKGLNIKLRVPQRRDLSWWRRAFTPGPRSFTYQLHPRDLAGAQAFGELRNRGLEHISDALWQSAHHVLGFFKALRAELAFYVACLNLYERLDALGEAVTYPEPRIDEQQFRCKGLRDVCLSLMMGRKAVGNDADANGKPLVIITGVNRGGKSTFLRSVGLAQLMMQCGMFVTADQFTASLHSGLFTHFKREEDRTMESGKFDEELSRLSAMADHIHRRALVLFNESFAATNEREGSEIARQIATALLEQDVTVFFVSHMHEFARLFIGTDATLLLRAERNDAGGRDFRLREGAPTAKSFGADLYDRIFSSSPALPGSIAAPQNDDRMSAATEPHSRTPAA